MFSQARFPHRHNSNGTVDSICTECFATVATALDESELSTRESAHVCDPVNLYWVTQCCHGQPLYIASAAIYDS
jgi:hypothetical protein